MGSTPHFLKFVRALALVGGGALAACSTPPVTNNDAATDGAATSETSAPDASAQPDVSSPDATTVDTGVLVDTGVGADAASDVAVAVDAADARADVGVDVLSADGSTCPEAAPMNAAACTLNGQSCMYTGAGGEFTQCMCASGTWMCFTAVPGPLPPPELMA